MFKKIVITAVIMLLVGVACFGAVRLGSGGEVALPQAITEESACPVAGCVAGECHAATAAPVPDGSFQMECPEAKDCTSSECHAWDALTSRYQAPSDWSMNVWIIAPVLLVIALALIVRKL